MYSKIYLFTPLAIPLLRFLQRRYFRSKSQMRIKWTLLWILTVWVGPKQPGHGGVMLTVPCLLMVVICRCTSCWELFSKRALGGGCRSRCSIWAKRSVIPTFAVTATGTSAGQEQLDADSVRVPSESLRVHALATHVRALGLNLTCWQMQSASLIAHVELSTP